MSHAYVVGQVTVKDAGKWDEYRARVPQTLSPWGAELVFRGKQAAAFAGENPHPDIVVIRFPDVTAANNWFTSPAYQSLVPLRQQAADVLLTAYEA
jgi:uncharacterized protein (DUF1330 family)